MKTGYVEKEVKGIEFKVPYTWYDSHFDIKEFDFLSPVDKSILQIIQKYILPAAEHRPFRIFYLGWSFERCSQWLPVYATQSGIDWLIEHKESRSKTKVFAGTDNAIYKFNEDAFFLVFSYPTKNGFSKVNCLVEFESPKEHLIEFLFQMVERLHKDEYQLSEERDDSLLKRTFLPGNIKERIVEEIETFVRSAKVYKEELKIPWKKGILLTGPPGNGKTLLIRALSRYFRRNFVDLKDCIDREGKIRPTIGREESETLSLYELHRRIYPTERLPTFYYLEDLDKFAGRSFTDLPRVPLTDLLNFLDGVKELEGALIIATTNYANELAEALTRPGRFDSIYEINLPDQDQMLEMFKYYNFEIENGDIHDVVKKLKGFSMAFVEDFVKASILRYKTTKVKKEEAEEVLEEILRHDEKNKKIIGFVRGQSEH